MDKNLNGIYSDSKTLTLFVSGGLGNQLFALAAGYTLASSTKSKLQISASKVSLGSNSSRKLALTEFRFEEQGIEYVSFRTPKRLLLWKKISRRLKISKLTSGKNIGELFVGNNETVLQTLKNFSGQTHIEGHFINCEWFTLAKGLGYSEVLELKNISEELINAQSLLGPSDAVIHVRIGDYKLHPDIFPIVSERYVLESIEYLKSKGIDRFYLLTDSINEFRTSYPNASNQVNMDLNSLSLTPGELLMVMTGASALVTSNSTFSVSAAMHSRIPDEMIVTPTPHQYGSWVDHLPNKWHRISIFESGQR